MEFILIFGLAWIASKGWAHLKADFGRSRDAHAAATAKQYPEGVPAHVRTASSRRHMLGYMGREALHGFPVWRTGLHMGMLSHRTALAHARVQRENARDTHDEMQKTLRQRTAERRAQQFRDQEEVFTDGEVPEGTPREQARASDDLAERRRQKAAKAGSGESDGTSPSPDSPDPGPYAPQDDLAGVTPSPDDPRYQRPGDSEWLRPGDPRCPSCQGTGYNADRTAPCPACRGWGHGPGNPDAPEAEAGAICEACGNPGRPGDPVVQDGSRRLHRSHITDDITRRENATDLSPDASRNPAPIPESPEGAPVPATDTTFTSVHASADNAVKAAEAAAAETRRAQATALDDADSMAGAGVDAAVIDAQMTLADLQDKAAKSHDAVLEAAGIVKSVLTRFHGGMQEAHDDSPGSVATREFHAS